MNTSTSIKLVLITLFISFSSVAFSQEVNVFTVANGEISATYSNSTVGKLIDNNVATEYTFSGLPNEIIYRSPRTYAIKRINFISSLQVAGRDPKSIEFSASQDGINWVVLRTTTNLTFTDRNQTRTIPVNSNQPYAYFRLKINALGLTDATICSLSEWELIGEEKALSKSPTGVRANPLAYNVTKISWRDNSADEDRFEIQRTANGTYFTTIATLDANTTHYIDSAINANAFYMYRVSSLKDEGKSAFSVSNSIITPSFPAKTLLTEGRNFSVSDQNNDSPTGEGVTSAFDNDENTKYLTRRTTAWLKIEFNEAFKVEQYGIVSANDSPDRDPKNWRLEASSDESNWTVLDNKENQVFDQRYQKRYFEVKNTGAYKFYRLNITQNNGNSSMTQLADWLLFADVAVGDEQIALAKPTNFQVENRAYHHVKLSWNDVGNEAGYRIERSEDGGANFTHTYEIPANNTEAYPYSLKPETNYVFKIYAVNGNNVSEAEIVSVTTGKKEFAERWENFNLWILDAPTTVRMVKQIGKTAFYLPEEYNVNDVDDLYYQFYAENWEYVFSCYGEELSDEQLHVMLFPLEEGGGLASIFDYRGGGGNYTNMVYIKANKNWFKNRAESGYIYDVMAHELCHIIEGVGGGYNGSMFYPVWGDSKWAEILQFDIFQALGVSRAASWHSSYAAETNPAGGADYPNSAQTSYWYRDFLYPTYDKYGKTELLKKFWKLQGEHYRMKNGSFQGTPTNPGGRGNLGELIHFWSGAARVDVKPYVIKAFGWNEQFEAWLQKAKIDYPLVTYSDAPIDNSYKNICQNGGEIKSNYSINNIKSFIDNNYQTFYTLNKATDKPQLELIYFSPVLAQIDKYLLVVRDNIVPSGWILYGSNNEEEWTEIDAQNSPVFTDNKITVQLNSKTIYKHYKFVLDFNTGNQIKLSEIELWGIEYASAPYDLKAQKITDESVYIDWTCALDEVARFELERSNDGINFSKIADLNRYEISYVDENLTASEYHYRVASVNKNSQKETAYSNVAYVNTTVNSTNNIDSSSLTFWNVFNNLSDYPQNRVVIYTPSGQKVYENQYNNNDMLQHLRAKLSQGIYVVKIVIGETAVTGKIKI